MEKVPSIGRSGRSSEGEPGGDGVRALQPHGDSGSGAEVGQLMACLWASAAEGNDQGGEGNEAHGASGARSRSPS